MSSSPSHGARLNIAVVGAGVAGAAVSTALARAGHSVALFEQSPALHPIGAGLLLQPSGQAALTHLGLLDQVIANAEPINTLHALRHHPRRPPKDLIHLHYHDHSPTTRAYGVHRADLFLPLHNAALAAGTTLHLNHAPHATRPAADNRLSLILADNTVTPPFDLVVAADGARSRLRQSSALRALSHTYTHTAIWALGPCSSIRNKLLQVTQGTRRLLGILPTGPKNNGPRCSFFWGLTPDEYPRLLARGFPAWRADCLKLCPHAEEIFTDLSSFDQVTFAPFHHVHMPRWHNSQNLVFIGDAAHAMSPHFGQGVNLALLDALSLARAIDAHPTLPEALLAHEKSPPPHTRLYASLSLALTPFFQGSGHLKGVARNIALPLMTKIPPLKSRMLQTMTGLRPSLTGR